MEPVSGSEALLETLKKHQVEYIFGSGGSALRPIHDSLIDQHEIKHILSLHEMCAVAMADGYARASGKTGFSLVHGAVGAVNALGSLFAAQRDKTPLVVLAGDRETHILGRRSYNESFIPLPEIVRPFVKWSWQILRAEKIAEEVNKAFKIAEAPPAGPVFLSLPLDMMVQRVDPSVSMDRTCNVSSTIRANQGSVDRAARLIRQASRPIIVIGSGVGHSRASREVFALAEKIGAPVFLERNSFYMDLPATSPVFAGEFSVRHPLAQDADLLLVIGGRTDIEVHYHPGLQYEYSSIIQITTDAEDIGLLHKVDAGIIADPGETIKDILRSFEEKPLERNVEAVRARIKAVEVFRQTRHDTLRREIEAHRNDDPVSPSFVIQTLAEIVDGDPIVVSVSPSSEGMAMALLGPSSFFAQNGAGYLGWGLPASLGVKVAMPARKVICLLGDGGFMFGPQALWTAVKYQLPVFTLVLNNKAYLVDRSHKMAQKNVFIGTELGQPDMNFATMGESMGVKGFRITQASHVKDVLKEAWKLNEPVIVDALVSGELPREFLHS